MEKLIKIAVFGLIGWAVGEITEEALASAGVPKQAATVAGTIIGGLI